MKKNNVSTTTYYDQISTDYDTIMDHERVDIVRKFVKNYCLNLNDTKIVLDFGAGTGGDTLWHLEFYEKIIFYEPSSKMASYAKEKIDSTKRKLIDFIVGDDATLDNIKKYQDIDLIFSNFAVFNSIENPSETFHTFSKIINAHGNVVMVLYEKKSLKNVFKGLIGGLFKSDKTAQHSEIKASDGSSTKVFFHEKEDICSLAKDAGFSLIDDHYFNNGNFRMYHFKFHS